ncbi:MAG TPA: helix-turn-helix transcriptional regulator [Streptosporangiaceae bacterium]|nr:helix-turn-helix transcriptional regulator [Streptosporangiaceae bacterium]
MISIEPGSGPTVRRILLGTQLRRLREARGITREDAGYRIRASESKISRMELGRVGFKERDVVDLLALYGVEDETERTALVTLAREANAAGWWHQYADVLPDWFQTYVGLEEAASVLRVYEVQFVPGLLQTPAYARAIMTRGWPGAAAEDIERRVSMRITRQELLTKQGGPRLWAVVDEAALRRPVGSPEVFRSQLEHLIEVTQNVRITLQVTPFRSGGHAAEAGAFTIMRFPEEDLPDVVYLEQLTSALYLDKREDVERYSEVMERLSVESEPPERTADILREMLADLE